MMNRHTSQARRALTSAALLLGFFSGGSMLLHAQDAKKPAPPPDVILFTNGDQLSGKFVREVGGTVTFHSDIAGDINVGWDKIKELHTTAAVSVLKKGVLVNRKTPDSAIPSGLLAVSGKQLELQTETHQSVATIPLEDASYIIDRAALDKELRGHPGFFQAWNGTATAGATIVSATQKQYTFNGAVAMVRVVPTASWLAPRNRTSIDFAGSYGKITEPSYVSGGVLFPGTTTKSDLYHADAERDQYFSPRFFALGQVAFDHNFSQSLDLQQIYGGGIGWTAIKKPKQELDLKGTIQYEKQSFENTTADENQNLIGSTIAANYSLTFFKGIVFAQGLNYIPAFNNSRAWSVSETDVLTLPAYKNFGFTIGTVDSYLNDVAITEPPTKRNSLQFTLGVTYTIKSSY